jgi:DinB superfamily
MVRSGVGGIRSVAGVENGKAGQVDRLPGRIVLADPSLASSLAHNRSGHAVQVDWGRVLVGQLEFYWDIHLRPRLDGLTDEEYFWEPVDGCWSLRRAEDGSYQLDQQRPAPSPPPVTTIAWRLVHLGAGCLANRASAFFGDGSVPDDADMADPRHVPTDLPGSATEATAFLEQSYRQWHDGIASLDDEGLRRPLGPKGGPYANDPMAELIVHINREVMHHGAEICLLRDLYRAAGVKTHDSRLIPQRRR